MAVIARKQQKPQEGAWAEALARAYEKPDHDRANRLLWDAVHETEKRVHGHRVAFGWSGGKDSQLIRAVAERAGIRDSVLVISELEYPAFLTWVADNMPWGLHVETRPLDLAWLVRNPNMLFPMSAAAAVKWFRAVQHQGQRDYCRQQEIEILVLGRRKADGNFIGKGGREYVDPKGFVRFSPIADWTAEDALCVLGALALPLPPCYWWPRGFQVGTGPWPARQFQATREQAWAEVKQIDPEVVELAARANLPGAKAACAA